MRIADLLTAVILALGGGLVVYDSVRLGIGWGSDGPRSGFFPFWLAVIMIVACVAIMLQALRRTPTEPFLTRERLGPVLKVLWPATAAVVLMQFVGLYVAAAVYMGVYMRSGGRCSGAPAPRSSSTSPASRGAWSPSSTATRWTARDGAARP